MILYLDTSALIKLYVDEPHSGAVRSAVAAAAAVATHTVAYPEARAALARLRRENRLTEDGFDEAKAALEGDWAQFARVQALETLLVRAGELAELLALRGYDSVHLAAAEHVRVQSADEVVFACFDDRLNRAAALLGLGALHPAEPPGWHRKGTPPAPRANAASSLAKPLV